MKSVHRRELISNASGFRSRRASRAYLASRVFLPMDFGYSVGIVLASLCASAVGDSARGICCSGDSWDMARDAIVTFRGCDEGFRRTRGGHEKRAPGWGPRRFADTPLESGDAREAKACATEARGTRRPTRVGVCGSARASSAAPSCHERFFWRIGFGAFSCTAGQSRRKLAIRRRSMKPRGVVVGADDDASAALSRAPPPIS